MSIGNLKDSGNQGNNFPYQKSVLKGLSLSQCRNLEEVEINNSAYSSLATSIDNYFTSNPSKYLVAKSIIYDGTKYVAFLTIASL